MKNTLIVIDGPTASGKSTLAYQLAKKWSCPIISADSRQVFRHVNIGTAKPSPEMLASVKHYFIDHVDIDTRYNAGVFEKEANLLIDTLFKEHSKLILCGGSGLYIKAILHGLNELPASTKDIRMVVHELFEKNGIEALQKFVRITDPDYYQIVDLNNSRRLSRAVEVYLMTGKPFSSFRNGGHEEKNYAFVEITLNPDRNALYEIIEKRVDEMIENGLIDETRALMDYRDMQAMDTVGYKEIISHLDGEIDLKQATDLIKQRTRNYAKRQYTWFHKESKGQMIDPANQEEMNQLISKLDSY
jgi:tRNA dimethylallyltransferase